MIGKHSMIVQVEWRVDLGKVCEDLVEPREHAEIEEPEEEVTRDDSAVGL
jgi:hypothetical protein